MATGTETGTGMERSGQCWSNGTGNGEREGPAQAGRAVEEEDKKMYVGREFTGLMGVYVGEVVDTIWDLQYS